MPEGKDPDDYIKQNGKKSLIDLLKKKEIIQTFIWNNQLNLSFSLEILNDCNRRVFRKVNLINRVHVYTNAIHIILS